MSSRAACALLCVCVSACSTERSERTLAVRENVVTTVAAQWQALTPELAPPPRIGHLFVFDPSRSFSIVAGGRPIDDVGASRTDTWLWNGVRWASSGDIQPRGFIRGVFDSERRATLTYGGLDREPQMYFDGTYAFAGSAWMSANTNAFGARTHYGIAYDASRSIAILFGGHQGSWTNDLWELEGESWSQKCLGACGAGARPAPRGNAVFLYDEAREVTLLFGGQADERVWNDTWTWDGSAWTELHPVNAPSPRGGAAAAYDPITRRVYLFGGASSSGVLGDLWSWDGEDWHLIADVNPPAARADSTLVWDTTRRRGVLYGGRIDDEAADFWELTLLGTQCASDDECHTGRCDDTRCAPSPTGGGGGTGGDGSGGAGGGAGAAGGSPDGGGAPGTGGGTTTGGGGTAGSGALPAGGVAGSAGGTPSGGTDASGAAGDDGGAPPSPSGGSSEEEPVNPNDADELKSLYSCTVSGPRGNAFGAIAMLGVFAFLFRRRRAWS